MNISGKYVFMDNNTSATRALDRLGVPYRLEPFSIDRKDIGPDVIAEMLGIKVDNIYKTLVMEGNHTSYLVAVVPVPARLKLQKVAALSGNSNCKLIPMQDLEEITGYVFAGCSPVGMKQDFPTFIHESVLEEKEIRISGGKPGLFLVVKPEDLINATNAVIADLVA